MINDDLLTRYLTGEANSEENRLVEQWYALSGENQKVLEQFCYALFISDKLRVMQSADPQKALQKLKERIRQKDTMMQRRLVMQRIQRAAAILLIPVLVLSGWLFLRKNELKTPVQYVELSTNPGMVATFELPDQSKVWLNGSSRLRYPVVFNDKKREIEMTGQGYFEIASDKTKPFVVRTGDSFSLEVTGTSFNLTAYEDEDIIETTLVEGSVRLLMVQKGRMVQRSMKPNEKVIYVKNTASKSVNLSQTKPEIDTINAAKELKVETIKAAIVDPRYDIVWKDHQIWFKNHPMEQVIRTLGRHFNVQFVAKNEKVMDAEITGNFQNEPLQQIMEYLEIASNIKYKITPAKAENGEMIPGRVEIW